MITQENDVIEKHVSSILCPFESKIPLLPAYNGIKNTIQEWKTPKYIQYKKADFVKIKFFLLVIYT